MASNVGLASAVLILGCIWFGYQYGFTWWLDVLIIYSLAAWPHYLRDKARDSYLKAKADFYRARARQIEAI